MKLKMKWLTGLTLGCLGCTLMGFSGLQTPVKTFADTIQGVDVSSFVMQNGAAVRKADDGIRFSVQMDAENYVALELLETDTVSVSYGMLITTSKYANLYALTEENVFGGNAKYYWDEKGTFVDESEQTQDQVRIVNQLSPVMGRANDALETDPYLLYGVITDTVPDTATAEVKKAYMQGKYVARAYIQYETKDENGETLSTQYYFADYFAGEVANNTRSMYQTALNRIQLDDSDSATLYENYVAPVLGEYTLTRTVDGQVKDSVQVTSTWTAQEVIAQLSMDGYKKVALSAVKDSGTGAITLTCDFTSLYSKPVITVANDTVEMYSGAEYDLLDGVTVTDEYDTNLTATVSDNGGFDGKTVGTFVITYSATNSKGQTATATKTVKVVANVVLEVATNSSAGWNGTTMAFAPALYRELTANHSANYNTLGAAKTSGIYRNVSNAEIVVDLTGGYGSAVILDKNGVVIEGRDGANGRLVNVDNPIRTSGPTSFTYNGTNYQVASNFARFMKVPTGGMAVVVYQGTFSGSDDGRTFIRNNLVAYGKVAQVYLDQAENPVFYTTYVNQGPTVSGNTAIPVNAGEKTQDEVDALVLAGLSFKDDNGSFTANDDITTGMTATITDRGGLDVSKAGTYTYTLTVSDGEKTTTFTRTVQVISNGVNITIGANSQVFATSLVAVNPTLTKYDNHDIVIYTKAYGSTQPLENNYSVITVFNRTTGKIVKIYDGVGAKVHNEANPSGTTGSQTNLVKTAWADLGEDEVMIIGTNDNGDKAGRAFLYGNRTIGATVSITGIAF